MMKFKHGFTIFDVDNPEDIIHFVGFLQPPTLRDREGIKLELQTDPEFSNILNDYEWDMRDSTQEELEYFQEICESDDPDFVVRIDEKTKLH